MKPTRYTRIDANPHTVAAVIIAPVLSQVFAGGVLIQARSWRVYTSVQRDRRSKAWCPWKNQKYHGAQSACDPAAEAADFARKLCMTVDNIEIWQRETLVLCAEMENLP